MSSARSLRFCASASPLLVDCLGRRPISGTGFRSVQIYDVRQHALQDLRLIRRNLLDDPCLMCTRIRDEFSGELPALLREIDPHTSTIALVAAPRHQVLLGHLVDDLRQPRLFHQRQRG